MNYVNSLWAAQSVFFDINDWHRRQMQPIEGSLHGPVRCLADMTPEEIVEIEETYGAKVLTRRC